MPSLVYLKKAVSTNDEIEGYFTLNKNENTTVYTFDQTKGRGQYGNTWDTLTDQNLAFSFCVQKDKIYYSNSLFNYYTAVLFQKFFANLTNAEVKIKWPNDLILKNKKFAGILIEAKKVNNVEVFIIGIGVNVLQTDFQNLPKAGSILTETGKSCDLHKLAEDLFSFLNENISAEISEEIILENFNQHLFRKNEVSVFEIKRFRQNGIIKNADSDGYLWIELENEGLQKFFHKEIELLY